MTDEVEDGGTAPKISSLIGVNRKRKWKEEVEEEEEEEEQQGEESSEADTSSDDEDDNGDEKVEKSEHPASVGQGTDVGPEGKEEEAVALSSEPKAGEQSAPQPKVAPVKMPSQPAVFVPVDRLPEIQVRCNLMIHFSSEVPCISADKILEKRKLINT